MPSRKRPSPAPRILLNGRLHPADAPVLRADDRGFVYGDGAFETVRIVDGRPRLLSRHLTRLAATLDALAIRAPRGVDLRRDLGRLVAENGLGAGEAVARITVSRGVGGGPRPGALGSDPTVLITARPLPGHIAERRRGVRLRTVEGPHRALPHHKTLCYLPGVLALAAVGPDEEPLLVDGDAVLEGATCNVFARVGAEVRTPPMGAILPGVARAALLAGAARAGIDVVEAPLDRAMLAAADAIWVSNALLPVAPVVALDGVGRAEAARPSAMTARLRAVIEASDEEADR